jgi:hypothetical protein
MGHVFAHKAKPAPAAEGSVHRAPVRSPQLHRILQRKCACGGTCPKCEAERNATLHRRAAVQGKPGTAPPIVRDVLRSPGQPLDPATRAYMEPRFGHDFSQVRVHADSNATTLAISKPDDPFEQEADRVADAAMRMPSAPAGPGHDFSQVRIHTDEAAAQSARAVDALAYTIGNHMVFGSGQYNPGSEAGRRLLAHELSHTIQQGSSGLRLAKQRPQKPQERQKPNEPSWSERVTIVSAMADGDAKYKAMAAMIQEALEPFSVTVQESTNSESTVDEAITNNCYIKLDSYGGPHVNFDGFLEKKASGSTAAAKPRYPQTPTGGEGLEIFIIFGPRALHPVGPQHTRAVFEHERTHAKNYIDRFFDMNPGERQRHDTAGEHLMIWLSEFRNYFLRLWTFSADSELPKISELFTGLFANYSVPATPKEQETAIASIKDFYDTQIKGDECNMFKFKIWFRDIKGNSKIDQTLVEKMYALPEFQTIKDTPIGSTPKNCK